MDDFFQIRMRKYRFDFGDGSELEVAGLDNCFNVFVKGLDDGLGLGLGLGLDDV